MSFTVWLRSTSDGPRSKVKTPLTYWAYCTYQGSSRWNLRSRFCCTEAGTARSLLRNGLPLICRIIRNVNRITSRITGIVQRSRRSTNLVIARLSICARPGPEGRYGAAPQRGEGPAYLSTTLTLLRSNWSSRLMLKLASTDGFSCVTYVYQ